MASDSDHAEQMTSVYEHQEEDVAILAVLKKHLPTSIAAYRRIQSLKRSPDSHVYATFSKDDQEPDRCYAVAFVDRSLRPETELFLFLQHQSMSLSQDCDQCQSILLEMLELIARTPVQRLEAIQDVAQSKTRQDRGPHIILAGAIEQDTAMLMNKLDIFDDRRSNIETPYAKYIFSRDSMPTLLDPLPTGLRWNTMTAIGDLELVISRTSIPRQVSTLATLKSAGVFQADTERPIGWGFISADGSLQTLHVEPEWRRRGIARLIAARLISTAFGKEGYSHADVGLDNMESRKVCESIGGQDKSRVYWLRIDLHKVLSRSQNESRDV